MVKEKEVKEDKKEICPFCQGLGYIRAGKYRYKYHCDECDGTGFKQKKLATGKE
jgi:DnaJ-class molecular chaperone